MGNDGGEVLRVAFGKRLPSSVEGFQFHAYPFRQTTIHKE